MKLFALSIAALLIATPALAGTSVSLRSDTTDADGKITLGELFDGAGAASDVVVAARVGPSAVLDAGAVQIAARRAGLDWSNTSGVRRIIVRQGSTPSPGAWPAPRAATWKFLPTPAACRPAKSSSRKTWSG
jgi:flagella basal body P-ring formation protein FlgA